MKLKKVSPIGERAFHVYKDLKTGEFLKVSIQPEEYRALASGKPETREGFEWVSAHLCSLYDTPSGELEDGCYAESPDGMFDMKLRDKSQESVHQKLIAGDELDEKELALAPRNKL